MKRHQNDTKDLKDLTFNEQSKSINAQIANVTKAMRAHFLRAASEGRDTTKIFAKREMQFLRAIKNFRP